MPRACPLNLGTGASEGAGCRKRALCVERMQRSMQFASFRWPLLTGPFLTGPFLMGPFLTGLFLMGPGVFCSLVRGGC